MNAKIKNKFNDLLECQWIVTDSADNRALVCINNVYQWVKTKHLTYTGAEKNRPKTLAIFYHDEIHINRQSTESLAKQFEMPIKLMSKIIMGGWWETHRNQVYQLLESTGEPENLLNEDLSNIK